MKKILLVGCALVITFGVSAQMQSGRTTLNSKEVKVAPYKNTLGQKTDVIEWFNYAETIDGLVGGDNYFSVLWPDSLAKFNYSGTYNTVNFHSMGQVFDPKDAFFINNGKIDSNDAYTVDSIAIPYRYFRFSNQPNPDTLVLHIFKHDVLGNYTITSNNRAFKTGEYDYMTQRATNFSDEIIEILDNNDSTSLADFLEFEINVTVNPGEVMGAVWTYLPGNPYSEGDTVYGGTDPVGNPLNRFDAFRHSDPAQTYSEGYFNSGEVVPLDVRYNTGTSWDGLYISGIAYTNYINVNVNFHVEALNTGIEDAQELGFSVNQNYPNPFSNSTIISYALASQSMVNIEVFDITGKSVMSINEGSKNAGEYQVELDGSNLKGGVYYYTFKTEAGQVTKKMMIQR